MKNPNPFRSAFVLAALGALVTTQGVAAQHPSPGQAKEAAVAPKSVVPKPLEIALPVTGLSKENVAALRQDLLALSARVYTCPSCKHEQPSEGSCPKCRAALAPETRTLLTAVEPAAQLNRLALTTDPRVVVSLSRIEAALTKRAVQIDDEHFTLAGRSQLLLRAPPLNNPSAIEKTLLEAKLFEEVKAEIDSGTNQVVLSVRAGASPPTRTQVTAALEGIEARLTDVIWGPAAPKS